MQSIRIPISKFEGQDQSQPFDETGRSSQAELFNILPVKDFKDFFKK